jgi:fatty acid synthase subunit alpha
MLRRGMRSSDTCFVLWTGAEFGSPPDGAEEMPLNALAQRFASSAAAYRQPGRVLTSLSSKAVGAALPGAFGTSQARAYLKSTYGASDSICDGVLVHALTAKPTSRLASEAEVSSQAHSFPRAFLRLIQLLSV